jgi:hypothetical protein
MRTGICLFLDWENGIWVTGSGNERHKNGNGKKTNTIIKTVVVGHNFKNSYRAIFDREFV